MGSAGRWQEWRNKAIAPYGQCGIALPHLRPDALGAYAAAFADRPEDDLRAPDQVSRRHIPDLPFHAAVDRVVAVVAQHEIVAGGYLIFLGVVVGAVIHQVERRVAYSVRQGLAPLLDADLPAVFGVDEVVDPLALD